MVKKGKEKQSMLTEQKEKKLRSIRESLKEWYLKKREEEKHEPLKIGEFYASMAGKCPRQIHYQKQFWDLLPSDRLLGIFMLGDILHEKVQEIYGGEAEVECGIKERGIEVKGRADIVLEDEVIELKTIADSSKVKDQPLYHHILQLQIYLKALNKKKGRLVYLDKKTLNVVEFEVEYNPVLYEEAIKSFEIVKYFEEKGETPPRMQGFWCNYCEFRKMCWGNIAEADVTEKLK